MDEKLPEYALNGWTFKIDHDTKRPVSWVYKDVKNYGYNFATEISIEKIIVEVEKDGKVTPLSLEYSDFAGLNGEELAGFKEYNPKTVTYSMNVSNFSGYLSKGRLLAFKTRKDVLPAKVVEGKTVNERLYFFLSILFGEYGNDPPHEFTGALQAARFTPALRFETKNDSVKSIRVHYRFHFNVDSYLKDASALTKLTAELKKEMWGIKNYASLIRDADQFPPSVLPTIRLLKDVLVMFAELKFFDAQLEACNFEGTCRFQAAKLKLEISEAGTTTGGVLNISYHDPRTSLNDPVKTFTRTAVSLIDEKVDGLNVASSLEYNESIVDELAAKIFTAIVGPTVPAQGLDSFAGQTGVVFESDPLPGVPAACLTSNIKYLLVQLVLRNFRRRRAAGISKQLQSVKALMKTDLADILKYLEPGDFDNVLDKIEDLVRAILQEPLLPVIGPLITLKSVDELIKSVQQVAGKILSIASFEATEKPVLFEAIGTYVKEGNVTDTWDNLHWWGTEKIPSAPGAFHAIHSHYRWTQLNAYPTAEVAKMLEAANAYVGTKGALHLGAPQLRSLVKRFADSNLSGPLIDPAIPTQTISLALALNGGVLDLKLMNSVEPFENVSDVTPEQIATTENSVNSGKDIVYWLSCHAVKTEKDIFKGTLLINGFYFAHDEEKPFSLFLPANLFAPTQGVDLQKPKREKPYKLFRGPMD